jgi:hypothetical protein
MTNKNNANRKSACADLRNGYNYEPESGILDPRYGPPDDVRSFCDLYRIHCGS